MPNGFIIVKNLVSEFLLASGLREARFGDLPEDLKNMMFIEIIVAPNVVADAYGREFVYDAYIWAALTSTDPSISEQYRIEAQKYAKPKTTFLPYLIGIGLLIYLIAKK